jgi:hypothetical protein
MNKPMPTDPQLESLPNWSLSRRGSFDFASQQHLLTSTQMAMMTTLAMKMQMMSSVDVGHSRKASRMPVGFLAMRSKKLPGLIQDRANIAITACLKLKLQRW